MSVVIPIVAVFTLFNLIVSGEAIENLYRAVNGRKQNEINGQHHVLNITEAIAQAAKAAAIAAKLEQAEENEKAGVSSESEKNSDDQNTEKSDTNPNPDPTQTNKTSSLQVDHHHSQHLLQLSNKLNQLLSQNTKPSLAELEELSDELQAAHNQQLNTATEHLFEAVMPEDKEIHQKVMAAAAGQKPIHFSFDSYSSSSNLDSNSQATSKTDSNFTPDSSSLNNDWDKKPIGLDNTNSIPTNPNNAFDLEVQKYNSGSNFANSPRGNAWSYDSAASNPGSSGSFFNSPAMPNPPSNNQHCISTDIDWSQEVTPKYALNPTKVLVPALYQGPNNQVFGFRESMIMAIKLNRTLIIPPFYPYVGNDAVDFGHSIDGKKRINMEMARKLISIKPASYLDEGICGTSESSFDISFQTRVAQCTAPFFDRLQTFQFHIKRKLLRFDNIGDVKAAATGSDECSLLNTDVIQPKANQFMDKKQPVALNFDTPTINQIFSANNFQGTNCAALILPFKSFPLSEFINVNKPDKMLSLKIPPEEINLVKNIITATPRPLFIQELAARFLDEVMRVGTDFLGIHWAYDRVDWFSYSCNGAGVSAFMKTKCEEISMAHEKHEMLATGIAKLVRYYEQKGAIKSRTVYIASKPNDEEYFKDVLRWLRRETPVKMFTMTDVKNYLRKYDDCGYTRNDSVDEIVSLLEQEIVYRCNIFVRSVVSSWSLNVQLQRAVERRDKEDVTNWRLLTPDIINQNS